MSFSIVIPARFGSTRLKGKPLLDLVGKPIIQHVYECAIKTSAEKVIIATDDQRIADAAKQFNAEVCLTNANHQSGTDRITEVVEKYQFDDQHIIVNLQGDEPDTPVKLIEQTAQGLIQNPDADMSTLATKIETSDDIFNPNVVKVVFNQQQFALYFSRAPIPWNRDKFGLDQQDFEIKNNHWFRHIGLYGYRCGFLKRYKQWQMSDLEQIESLEQLRVLFYGGKIHVGIATCQSGHGIDTQADLDAMIESFNQK